MSKKHPLSRKKNVVVQETTEGELLIYDLTKSKAFCLNETATQVWKLCDGSRSISEISHELENILKTPASENLVWLALDQLKKENLIESEITTPTEFEGLSRRQIIKKVGFSSMIMLPVVAGLVAPAAGQAVSCSGGCTCSMMTGFPGMQLCNTDNSGTPCVNMNCRCERINPDDGSLASRAGNCVP